MLQLIAKKLGLTVIFGTLFCALIYFYLVIYMLVSGGHSPSAAWSPVLFFVLYLLIVLCIVSFLKHRNKRMRQGYSEHLLESECHFQNNIRFILKSEDFLSAVIAFNGFLLPLELAVALEETTPFFPLIFSILLLIVLQTAVFSAIDIGLWLITFARWNK